MANVYSSKTWSRNEPKPSNDKPGLFSAIVIAIISGIVVDIVIKKLFPEAGPLTAFLLFLPLYFICFFALRRFYKNIKHQSMQVLPGFQAWEHQVEDTVLAELAKLPEHFSVYHYLELPNKKPIHFVVTNESGIFGIRVKHYGGIIGYDGTELTHNGSEFPDSALVYETKRQTEELEHALESKFGVHVPVRPILLFSRDTTVVNFIELELHGVTLLKYDHLDYYLLKHPCPLPRIDLVELHKTLLPFVHRGRYT